LLVEPWPESVQGTDARGLSPALLAAAGDAPIGVVYFLVSKWPEDVSRAVRRQSCLEMLGFLASESVHYHYLYLLQSLAGPPFIAPGTPVAYTDRSTTSSR
jgi:hypothetical protein